MRNTLYTLTLAAIFILSMDSAEAQQLGRRTQFLTNTYLVNPAVAGTKPYTPIMASYRNQWTGFDQAPTTYTLSGHTSLPNKLGVGGVFFRDDAGGAITNTGMELTGTYKVDLNNEDAVSFGLSAVVGQYRFDNSALTVLDENDPAILGNVESETAFDANFGMMVYGKNYFFGASVPQLLQTKLNLEGFLPDDNQRVRHYMFMGSYLYYLNEDISIQPSALVKFTATSPVQFDFYVRTLYQDSFWASVSYRNNDAVCFGLGMEYGPFVFAYGYDITVSDARAFSPHTHELTIGYLLPRKGSFTSKSLLGPRRLGGRLVK